MNHADRQRLSQLLEDMYQSRDLATDENIDRLAEARAIVDGTTMCGNCGHEHPVDINCPPIDFVPLRERTFPDGRPDVRSQMVLERLGAYEPPSPKLDAFLREPIHEYRDPNDTGISGYIRHPLGWQKPRRRHRALSTRRIALTTLIAGMILLALTASRTPTPSPSHQPTPERAAKPAPTTAQGPYRPGHQPGTPGNGLGVAAPSTRPPTGPKHPT